MELDYRLSWRDSEWQRVIFSDESRFSLGGDAQRIRVWRHRGQRQDERFVVTGPEGLVSLHLHPYRTICRNCVSQQQPCRGSWTGIQGFSLRCPLWRSRMSYWNVGDAEDPEAQPAGSAAQQDGEPEMGAKQSAGGGAPLGQSPTLENIRAAYGDGEGCGAHELIRIACQENGAGRPDGVRNLMEGMWGQDAEARLGSYGSPLYRIHLQGKCLCLVLPGWYRTVGCCVKNGVSPRSPVSLEVTRGHFTVGKGHWNEVALITLELLCMASQHGDMESVRFLLQEAQVQFLQEPSEQNPAILAAHYGHHAVIQELLDSIPRPCVRKDLLNWMLATACQQGHLEVVKLLVLGYQADAEDCAIHSDEFAVITGLPLYAAARAGNKEIADFLLENGAGFSSYTLMDHSEFSQQLLRQRLLEEKDGQCDGSTPPRLRVQWSGLKLQWLELDWFLDVSSRITVLDLSHNNLNSLPSVVPWGLIHLHTLNLSHNQFKELSTPASSQEIICSRLSQVNLCENELESLPTGLLHLSQIQHLSAAKNKLGVLFNIPNGTRTQTHACMCFHAVVCSRWSEVEWRYRVGVSDKVASEGKNKEGVSDKVAKNTNPDLSSAVLHCFKSLNSLNISRNRLGRFPDPWACPLKICRAANNEIESLPDTISIFWRTHLKEVDFSENILKELPSYIFELEFILVLTTVPPHTDSLGVSTKTKVGLVTEDDPLPF
ncbi:hypothetical protein NFI96_029665 [Prochilodus magdalenae]|nr:hypothetical protein NFI96_029665 [Prochilodus magdalenae]